MTYCINNDILMAKFLLLYSMTWIWCPQPLEGTAPRQLHAGGGPVAQVFCTETASILKELEKLCSWGGIMLHHATSTLHRMCNLQDVMRLARFLYQIQSVEKCSNVKKESLWLDRISQLTSLSTWDSENNTGLFTIFFTCFPNEQV